MKLWGHPGYMDSSEEKCQDDGVCGETGDLDDDVLHVVAGPALTGRLFAKV